MPTPPTPPFPDRTDPAFHAALDKIRVAVRLLEEAAAYFGHLRAEAVALLTGASYAGAVLSEYEEETTP